VWRKKEMFESILADQR